MANLLPSAGGSRSLVPSRRRFTFAAMAVVILTLLAAGGLLFFGGNSAARPLTALNSHEPSLTCVAFSADGTHLAAGAATGNVVVWNIESGTVRTLPSKNGAAVTAVLFTARGELLAGGVDRALSVWEYPTRNLAVPPQRLAELPAPVTSISVHPWKAEFALGLSNGSLYVLGRGTPHVDSEHRGGITRVAYDPAGRWLVTAGTDGRIVWRDSATRAVAATRDAHDTEIAGLAFNSDGTRLATGDWNGVIMIWDAAAHAELLRLSQPDAVSALVWNGGEVITAGWDGHLRVFSAEQARQTGEIHNGVAIHDVAISPNGQTAATVSPDGQARLWDLQPKAF